MLCAIRDLPLSVPDAGHKDALEVAQRLATSKGALKAVPVAVSGAFHTSLMQPARDALTEVWSCIYVYV